MTGEKMDFKRTATYTEVEQILKAKFGIDNSIQTTLLGSCDEHVDRDSLSVEGYVSEWNSWKYVGVVRIYLGLDR